MLGGGSKVGILVHPLRSVGQGGKADFPHPHPGPWAGTVSHTDQHEVAGLVSGGEWVKTQGLVQELASLVASSGERGLPGQRLLEIRGFLNYVVRTYPWMNPYLKGLHLTIDGWREGRAEGGLKPTGAAAMADLLVTGGECWFCDFAISPATAATNLRWGWI